MIRSKKVRLNATLNAKMIKMLLYGEATVQELSDETGLGPETISRYCRELHKIKAAHIVGWGKSTRGADTTAIWKLGRGVDVPRAVKPSTERSKAWRQRQKQLQIIQRMAGQLKEAA